MRARPAVLMLVAASFVLPACGAQGGGSDSSDDFTGERQRVAQAVEDLEEAGRRRDGNRICEELLAPALLERIRAAGGRNCADVVEDALSDADAFDVTVERVTVRGATATAVVETDTGDDTRRDTLTLARQGQTWKISALG